MKAIAATAIFAFVGAAQTQTGAYDAGDTVMAFVR